MLSKLFVLGEVHFWNFEDELQATVKRVRETSSR